MSKFHIGQKVVCIHPVDDLTTDVTYTVTCVESEYGEHFVGVDRSIFKDPSFFAWRFRPLVTRKTDISCFTALLNTTKAPVPA